MILTNLAGILKNGRVRRGWTRMRLVSLAFNRLMESGKETMNMTMWRSLLVGGSWMGLVASVGISGCGDSEGVSRRAVYEVTGKVLRGDGQPLSGGHVYFVPKEGVLTPEA